MMTKRAAESSSLQDSPHKKKKCGSARDAERELDAVNAVVAPPALFPTLIGERRRKRPRSCEDYERHQQTGAQGSKMSSTTDGGKKEVADERASGKFPAASDVCACAMASQEIKADSYIKTQRPGDNEDDLSVFNSFQFWRTPLPALDLSLLDAPSTAELCEGLVPPSLKDGTEEMET